MKGALAAMERSDYQTANSIFRNLIDSGQPLPEEMPYYFSETLFHLGQFDNSQNFVKLNCDYLNSYGTDLLVLSSDAENAFAWPDGSLCEGLYTKVLIPNIGILGVRR